jgi:hypothetical protein
VSSDSIADIIPFPMPNRPGKRTAPGTSFMLKVDVELAEAIRAKAKELKVTNPELIEHCCRVVLKRTIKPKPTKSTTEDVDLHGF